MKTITTTTDYPVGATVRAKFTVLGDTRVVRRPPAYTNVTETYDWLVGIERIPTASVEARAAHWHKVANGLPLDPVVPSEIANWRARAVLEIVDLLPTVTDMLEAMTGQAGIVARAAWAAGAPLVRNGPTVLTLAAAIPLTPAEIDAMFIQAAALDV